MSYTCHPEYQRPYEMTIYSNYCHAYLCFKIQLNPPKQVLQYHENSESPFLCGHNCVHFAHCRLMCTVTLNSKLAILKT